MFKSKSLRRHSCPVCTWFREWHDQEDWLMQYLDHPIYGYIRNDVLVNTDIKEHLCHEYVAAKQRAPREQARNAGGNVWVYERGSTLAGRPTNRRAA